jgi:hypothetical protein
VERPLAVEAEPPAVRAARGAVREMVLATAREAAAAMVAMVAMATPRLGNAWSASRPRA